MRLIKGMLARAAKAPEHDGRDFEVEYEIETAPKVRGVPDLLWDEEDEAYPDDIDAPEAGAPAAGAAQAKAQAPETAAPRAAEQDTVLASPEADEEADEEPFDEEDDVPKIWEMLDAENDKDESARGGDGEDVTQSELARAALKLMNARAMGDEGTGQVAGRAKTRLLGFHSSEPTQFDVFSQPRKAADTPAERYPVGWLVVIEGPGRGASFTLFSGVSKIGRGEDQTVRLSFGDTSISRDNHAAIAYDDEQNMFFLGHGGKANLVRLNGKPVLSTEQLSNADLIRIGETKLRFVALCSSDFAWDLTDEDEIGYA